MFLPYDSKMFYVYEIRSKKIRLKSHSRNVAVFNLESLNDKRGELWCAMMDSETYEKNYGNGKYSGNVRDGGNSVVHGVSKRQFRTNLILKTLF